MSRTAMILMAMVLALATAATAATAFAGAREKIPNISKSIVDAIEIASDASQHARMRPVKQRSIPTAVRIKVAVRR